MSADTVNRSVPRWADGSRHAAYDMTVGYGHVEPGSIWDLAMDAKALFHIKGHVLEMNGVPLMTGRNEGWAVAHIRTDTDEVLAVHPGSYRVRSEGYYKNLEQLEATFPETCVKVSSMDGGRKLMTQHQIGESLDLPNGDTLLPTIIGIASLDSTWPSAIHSFSRVLSCSNMLSQTSKHLSVKASRNHDSALESKMFWLESAMSQARTIARIARISADMEFTDFQFRQMIETLPGLAKFKARADAPRWKDGERVPQHGKTINAWENRRDALLQNWGKEKELKGGANMWAAFNAVQGAEQHTISVGFSAKKRKEERKLIQLINSEHNLEKQAFNYLRFDELASA